MKKRMRWTLVYEINEMKKTRQIPLQKTSIPLLKYMKMGNSFTLFLSPTIVLSTYCLYNTKVIKTRSNHISLVYHFVK